MQFFGAVLRPGAEPMLVLEFMEVSSPLAGIDHQPPEFPQQLLRSTLSPPMNHSPMRPSHRRICMYASGGLILTHRPTWYDAAFRPFVCREATCGRR